MTEFNLTLPTIKKVGNIEFNSENNYNRIRIDKLYNKEPSLRKLLDLAPLTGNYKYTHVKIIQKNYLKESCTCKIPGWHLDGKLLISNDYILNKYHLFVSSLPTEFILKPINLIGINQKEIIKSIPKNISIYNIPTFCYNTYSERHFHRGTIAKKEEEFRFFLRITESNYVKPIK